MGKSFNIQCLATIAIGSFLAGMKKSNGYHIPKGFGSVGKDMDINEIEKARKRNKKRLIKNKELK